MRVADKIVFLFKDSDGFASAIANSLCPNPNSSFHRLDESFKLSLENYGVHDLEATGDLIHFIDSGGNYQVSVLLLEKYEPPTLVCAMSKVLSQLIETSSSLPTLVVPSVGTSPKLKWDSKASWLMHNDRKVSLYSVQIGPETDVIKAIATRTQKAPPSLQIHYEPLACFLQLARVLKLPTSIIFGRMDQSLSNKAAEEELKVLYEIGELLANTISLSFSKEKMALNPENTSKDVKEPWRALYG